MWKKQRRRRHDAMSSGVIEAESSPDRASTDRHTVAIYVSDHCVNCEYAREIAELIQIEYPHVNLRVVDLAAPGEVIPEIVFATPTYLLDDRVWSLGNPSPEQVRNTLNRLG